MGIILALVAFFLCVIIYVRMVRRETPEPLGKIKAAIPVVVGLAAPFLATALVILFGWLMKVTIGIPLAGLSDSLVYKSLVTSFVGAGFTEEFVKCMLLLLVVKILKPKNVYEYGIFCAGIAVGFTLLEELLYGNGNTVTALMRIPCFGLHVAFGVIMGTQLGIARYRKQNNLGGAGKYIFLGVFLPMLWHTLYDASTVDNTGMMVEDTGAQTIGLITALAGMLISVVLQFVVFNNFKKKSGEYCGMLLN